MNNKQLQIMFILTAINTAVIVLTGAIVSYALLAIRNGW